MFCSVADFVCSGFGRYLEAHLFTHATYKRRLVNYSIYLVLDNGDGHVINIPWQVLPRKAANTVAAAGD